MKMRLQAERHGWPDSVPRCNRLVQAIVRGRYAEDKQFPKEFAKTPLLPWQGWQAVSFAPRKKMAFRSPPYQKRIAKRGNQRGSGEGVGTDPFRGVIGPPGPVTWRLPEG